MPLLDITSFRLSCLHTHIVKNAVEAPFECPWSRIEVVARLDMNHGTKQYLALGKAEL